MSKQKPLTKAEKEAQAYIINEIEKAFNLMYEHFTSNAVTSGMVSLDYIKKSHHVFIEGMKKGAGLK